MAFDSVRLAERFLDFSVGVMEFVDQLPATLPGRHTGGQLFRSGTSCSADYEEACAAESLADFIHKLQISLKEARETRFWLRLLHRSQLRGIPDCGSLLQEADELCNILAKSIVTAKGKLKKKDGFDTGADASSR
jgi:four helix bundle protein